MASDDKDKRRGELGMSRWIKSGLSEATTIESSLRDSEFRLQIRVMRRCRRANFQNLVPTPRSRRDVMSSKIKVPAPTLVIIALMMNYRRG